MSETDAGGADALEGEVPPAPSTDGQVDVRDLPGGLRGALEAVLMIVDEPVPVERLAQVTGVPVAEVAVTLDTMAASYRDEQRGFELRQVGGGWRVYSAPAFADVVAQVVLEGQTARLTQAALETLAVVAYRQPVTRGQVSAVRGVNVDGVMRTLVARGLVAEVGTEPSGAHLYGTTASFLERMGFTSLDQLPPLAPYLPDIDGLDDLGPQTRVTTVPGEPSSPTSMKEQQ